MSTKKSSKLKSTHMIDTRDNIVEDLPIYGHNFKGVKSPPFVNIQTLIFASKQIFFSSYTDYRIWCKLLQKMKAVKKNSCISNLKSRVACNIMLRIRRRSNKVLGRDFLFQSC